MGRMKDILIGEEQKRDIAESIALEAGALIRCEYHNDIVTDAENDDAKTLAYKIANSRLSEKDVSVSGFKSRKELSDMIKSVIEQSYSECPDCRKVREE